MSITPFEILLPEELTGTGTPDLRIGSKVLDLLRSSTSEVQTLEVFEEMRLVNSNNAQLKQFVSLLNGAKQLSVLKSQIGIMAFAPVLPNSIGILCCLVSGVLHKFHIYDLGGKASLNYKFTSTTHENA